MIRKKTVCGLTCNNFTSCVRVDKYPLVVDVLLTAFTNPSKNLLVEVGRELKNFEKHCNCCGLWKWRKA